MSSVETTHYCLGSVVGPHPFPRIVRDFQSVIGRETRAQCLEQLGRLPDVVVACVGGGSNAAGMFYPFVADDGVALVGVEAGGRSTKPGDHAATLCFGRPGVLHGSFSYVLQDDDGQTCDVHSVSAGLDYPGTGPEHSYWKETGRATYTSARDDEALDAFDALARLEGILPALESSHAVAEAMKIAAATEARRDHRRLPLRPRRQGRRRDRPAARSGVLVEQFVSSCEAASGCHHSIPQSPIHHFPMSAIDTLFRQLRSAGRKAFMPFVTAGDPDLDFTAEVIRRLAARGCSLCELGIPYSDPIADGPVIQASYTRALGHKIKLADILAMLGRLTPRAAAADRHDGQLRDRLPARAGAIRGRCEGGGRGRGDRARPARRRGRPAGRDLPPRGFLAHPTHHAHHAARPGAADRRAHHRLHLLRFGDRHHRRADRAAAGDRRQRRPGSAQQTPLPICIGFGISRPEHVRMLAPVADGLIVGSAIVRRMAEAATKPREQVLDEIGDYAAELLAALGELR